MALAPEAGEAADGEAAAKAALDRARIAGLMGSAEYLFATYALLLPQMRAVRERTEDVCFLCKDGGDLVECDIYEAVEGRPTGCQCQKVYHTYCLGFEVDDDDQVTCARHSCCTCGEAAARFCRYCPTSYCSEHFPANPGNSVVPVLALEPLVVVRDQKQQQHVNGSRSSGGGSAGVGRFKKEEELVLFKGPEGVGAAPEFLCSDCDALARSAVRTYGYLPTSMLPEKMAAT